MSEKNKKEKHSKLLYRLFVGTMVCLMSVVSLSPMFVNAAVNETTTIINYGIYDFVPHTNMMNSDRMDHNAIITTNEGRTTRFNILGNGGFPRATSIHELLGGGYEVSDRGVEHEITISDWQKNTGGLYVDEVQIGAYAIYDDGSYAPMTIYKNGFYNENPYVGGGYWCHKSGQACTSNDVMYRGTPTKDNPYVFFRNLDLSYDGFLIRWDNPQKISKYVFTYFQINKCRTWDLVGWTTKLNDPLVGYTSEAKVDPNMQKKETYTTTAGSFNPNSSNKWINSVNASFNAGIQGLFDYPEQHLSTVPHYDLGRDYGNTRDSANPTGMSTNGVGRDQFVASSNNGFDFFSAYWSCSGDSCRAEQRNYAGDKKKVINANAVHWNKNSAGMITEPSNDDKWCSHTNAGGGHPCYKHSGHAHNTVWDCRIDTYASVSDSQKYVLGATYYYQKYSNLSGTAPVGGRTQVGNNVSNVTNKNGQIVSNPVNGNNIASIINVYDEGVFKLSAYVRGSMNKEITVNSGLYYIDKTSPKISFVANETGKWYTTTDLPKITTNVADNLSGVNKLQVMRYKSKDGVNWESNGRYDTVYDFGENNKTVRKDASMYKDIKVDLSATPGYMYYKIKAIATDVAGNTSDAESPIYKYDAYPTISYTHKPVRFYDEPTGKLNWTNKDVEVTFTVGDTESGLKELQITKGNVYNQNVITTVKKWSNPTINSDGFLVGTELTDVVKHIESKRTLESDGLYVHVVDKNNHVTTKPYICDHIDKQVPTISWGQIDQNTWFKDKLPDITATLKDDLSGVDLGEVRRYKSTDGKTWVPIPNDNNQAVWEGNNVSPTFDNQYRDDLNVDLIVHMKADKGFLYYKTEVDITDVAGNKATYTSPIIKHDRIPNISYELDPPRLKGDNTLNWVNTDVTVNITLTDDEVGVQAVCLANGTTWDTCINVIETWRPDNYHEDLEVHASFVEDKRTLQQEGLHLIVKDKIGNTNSTPYIVDHIDKVPPIINFTPDGYGPGKGPVDVTITVDDVPMKPDGGKSEVKDWEYCISNDNGANWDCTSGLTTPSVDITIEETGDTIIKVTVTDNAGNSTTSQSGHYIVIGNPPTLIARTDYWWVNETTDLQEILKNAEAISETDGVISDKIVITRITYQDGQVVDYPLTFRTDKAQSFVAEFEVTDSNGFSTKASQVYQVLDKESQDPNLDPGSNKNPYKDVEIYQRYVDDYKIAIQDNSYWTIKDDYRLALDAALNNDLVKDFEIVTRPNR